MNLPVLNASGAQLILNLHNFVLALGVEWSHAGNKSDARNLIKSIRNGYLITLPSPHATGEQWIGAYKENPKKALAAAALIGLVVPNAIVCEQITETETWVCVIQDQMPVAGFDQLVDPAGARQQATSMMSMFPKAELFGDLPGSKSNISGLLEQIAQNVADKAITKKTISSLQLRRVGVSPQLVLSIMLACAIPIAGYFAWDYYKKFDLARKNAAILGARAAQAAMSAEQLAKEKQNQIEAFNAKVQKRRDEIASQSNAGAILPSWTAINSVRQTLPVSQLGGYRPTRLACTEGQCQASWESHGIFTSLADRSKLTGTDNFADLSKSAKTLHPYTVQAALPDAKSAAPVKMNSASLRFALIDRFARTPGLVVEPPSPIVITPPPGLDLTPVTVGHMGAIKVTMTGPYALVRAQSLMEQLNQYPVAIKSIEFNGLYQSLSIAIEAGYSALEAQP